MEIATVEDSDIPDESAYKVAFHYIQKFCEDRGFTIFYARAWNTVLKGTDVTQIDVGSHTEFFYVDPPIDFEKE